MSTYRVGNHQPQNVYRDDAYIGVMFTAEDAALVVAALNGQGKRLDAMAAMAVAYAEMRTALTALVDPDPCSYDHSGECQAHGQGSDPFCVHARAKELLSGMPGPRPIRPLPDLPRRYWGEHPPHPTCTDVTTDEHPPGSSWVCGPACPREAQP